MTKVETIDTMIGNVQHEADQQLLDAFGALFMGRNPNVATMIILACRLDAALLTEQVKAEQVDPSIGERILDVRRQITWEIMQQARRAVRANPGLGRQQ